MPRKRNERVWERVKCRLANERVEYSSIAPESQAHRGEIPSCKSPRSKFSGPSSTNAQLLAEEITTRWARAAVQRAAQMAREKAALGRFTAVDSATAEVVAAAAHQARLRTYAAEKLQAALRHYRVVKNLDRLNIQAKRIQALLRGAVTRRYRVPECGAIDIAAEAMAAEAAGVPPGSQSRQMENQATEAIGQAMWHAEWLTSCPTPKQKRETLLLNQTSHQDETRAVLAYIHYIILDQIPAARARGSGFWRPPPHFDPFASVTVWNANLGNGCHYIEDPLFALPRKDMRDKVMNGCGAVGSVLPHSLFYDQVCRHHCDIIGARSLGIQGVRVWPCPCLL